MTPKEKAQELCKRLMEYSVSRYNAKEQAIICVDEIIKANPTELSGPFARGCTINYWQQVKEELKKM